MEKHGLRMNDMLVVCVSVVSLNRLTEVLMNTPTRKLHSVLKFSDTFFIVPGQNICEHTQQDKHKCHNHTAPSTTEPGLHRPEHAHQAYSAFLTSV